MRANPFSLPDPGAIFSEKNAGPYVGFINTVFNDPNAKPIRTLTVNPSQKTLFMICAGQSQSTNIVPTKYLLTNPGNVDNFNPFTGLNYAASDVLLGVATLDTGTFCANFNLRVADGLVSNGKFNKVVICPVAVAGTTMSMWSPESDTLGYYRAIQSTYLKLQAKGITVNTPGAFFLVKWNQGESDQQQSTSQSAYTNSFNLMKGAVQSYIPNCKFTVARETWITGNVSAAVQAAQTALVDNITIFAGENMDTIGSSGRQADNTHLNDAGAATAASMGVAAITAINF